MQSYHKQTFFLNTIKEIFLYFEYIYNNQCMQATKHKAKRKKKSEIEITQNKQKHFFVSFNDCLQE